MGTLVNFCAGASVAQSLPSKNLDGLLINVPNAGKNQTSMSNTKKLIEVANPKYLMLDSGGFSLYEAEGSGKTIIFDENQPIYGSNTFNLTPNHVVDVARKINPDILVALDYPIGKFTDKNAQEMEFRKKLGFNAGWAIQTSHLKEIYSPHIQLFIPIQCYNLNHLDEFLYFTRGINHENLCMPVRNLTVNEIADFMFRFYQLGVKRVHLLGVASFYVMALAAYLAKHYFEWVSLDAQTWRIEANYSKYLNPHDLSREYIGDNVQIDSNTKIDCSCPWCQYNTLETIRDMPYTDRSFFLMRHNFWVTVNVGQQLYEHADSLWQFKT
jgi:tRNA-guanine family transglycosylase